MNNYAYLIKAKAKATEAKSIFCWFSAKSDSRADREILNILEDEGITVGRAADHHVIVVAGRQAQQLVNHRAANEIYPH